MSKVLIVDDKAVNRSMLNHIISQNYEVIEAGSGQEALDILFGETEEISAVLLDIVMPEMDGFEVLSQIRNNIGTADIPVIVQTENSEEAFETKALKAGATDFVSKPYKASIINTRLNNVINTRIMLNEISNLVSDELTGLMSVNQFYLEGEKWIEENADTEFDVVAFDIVHFRNINDAKGLDGANKILKTIAERIKELQTQHMFLASRVYADRFILLRKRTEEYVDKLLSEADQLTTDYAHFTNVHIKFGIYEMQDRNEKLSRMCDRAFSATCLIKNYYGNKVAYYDEQFHQQILLEERINDEMENALKEHQFRVFYQPKYELFTESVAGAEALVRWEHPQNGMIAPADFIPYFEKNGFIVQLDQYVWEMVAEQIAKWYEAGVKVVPVSVNISRVDIERIDVVSILTKLIENYGISPELLHLEITESAYMQDTDKIIQVVSKLKENGFVIEMDDFGSGYSSLNMLAKLPINMIKLDMKFIQEIETSVNAKTIIEYTMGLAKWMDLPVVAEGVETDAQLELLKKLECNYVQGYVFAKPMPNDQFEILLRNYGNSLEKINCATPGLYIYKSKKKNRMLIVEDHQLNRSIIRSYFENKFSIVEAVNGKVALEYLNTGEKVDVILLDVYMPEMNGLEFLKNIKSEKRLQKIPTLVISARASVDEREEVLRLGADAFVPKPFTVEEIVNKVRILLRGQHILDDMDMWDLRELMSNPWMHKSCDELFIVDSKTDKICKVEGENIIDTNEKSTTLLPEDVLQTAKQTLDDSTKRYSAYKYKDSLINIQRLYYKDELYFICTKIKLNEIDEYK